MGRDHGYAVYGAESSRNRYVDLLHYRPPRRYLRRAPFGNRNPGQHDQLRNFLILSALRRGKCGVKVHLFHCVPVDQPHFHSDDAGCSEKSRKDQNRPLRHGPDRTSGYLAYDPPGIHERSKGCCSQLLLQLLYHHRRRRFSRGRLQRGFRQPGSHRYDHQH